MKDMYTVGELADFFGVSKDTIRLYDKMGLVCPTKDLKNNYRRYSREDLICMMYVMQLRKTNFSLEEVEILINKSTIEEAELMMQKQYKILGKKIRELMTLQNIVSDYQVDFNEVLKNLGKIQIREMPTLIYKEISSSMMETMEEFNRLTSYRVPKFTFDISKELFLSPEFNDVNTVKRKFKHTITLKDDDNLIEDKHFPKEKFEVIPARRCVCAIVRSYTGVDYESFLQVREYVIKNNFEMTGSALLRTISNKRYVNNYTDYYEMIVPIAE